MEEKTSNESINESVNLVTQEMVDEVQRELDETKKENKTKIYGIEIKTEAVKNDILDYLDNDIEWSHMEGYGVPKVFDAVQKEKIKNGNIYLKGLELEALTFYISKFKGKGRAAAKKFVAIHNAVDPAYQLRAKDNQKEVNLQRKLESLKDALEHNIAVDQN
jgi:hypothetical protein